MCAFRLAAAPAVALGAILISAVAGPAAARVAGPLPDRPPVPAASRPESAGRPAQVVPAALPAGHAWMVTLVTGDVVGVTTVRGRPPLVTVRPGPGRAGVIFSKFTDSAGHIEVVPQDVAPLIGRVLDPALFDVTTLIRNGDDDAHRSFLPLIVQGAPGARGARNAGQVALPSWLRRGIVLSSIGAVAAREPMASAARAGDALAAMASAVARSGRRTPRLTGGVGYIWLDRTVRASAVSPASPVPAAALPDHRAVLDHNLVQIGAPAAWRAGHIGAGVRVAVLDTGVDPAIPDLRGQVVAERNFTGSGRSVADHFGHGTFVAALIAGTGRSAGGERRGVAFGARLVIGKVLGNDGSGLESWAIAGMQWAAARAKIINLSFGASPTAGTDPLSMAVNRLTARHHVLFVAAAGNSGPSDETVDAPAAASDALAVGAVDGRDRLAFFSSRGPRLGDFAIKPEITAPGVDIVGDRAAGTNIGTALDAHYTIASGTSFAAPQVAGAAAILAGLHPRWGPGRLKAALVSTAHPATGGDIYQLGGGRVDIAAEVTDPVVADRAVADLGAVASGSAQVIRDRLSWTNAGRRGATVKLSVTLTERLGRPAPARAIGFTAARVRVPAGRSASATLVLEPGLLAGHPGLYQGRVVARDGGKIIATPVSFYLRPPASTLTIRATALPGTGPGGFAASAAVTSVGDPDLFPLTFVPIGTSGTATLRVPDGRYWVIGEVDDLSSQQAQRSALVGQPEVTVSRDTTVLLDGAASVPVTASVTGHPTLTATASVHVERGFAGLTESADIYYFGPPTASAVLYAQPTGIARTGSFHAYSAFRLVSLPSSTVSYVYDLYHLLGARIPVSAAYLVTAAQQARLARISVRFYAVGSNTAPVSEDRYGLTAAGFLAIQNQSLAPGGSTRTDYLSTGPGISWNQEVAPPNALGTGLWVIEVPGFRRYQPGSRLDADWARQPFAPGPYSATKLSVSTCAPLPTTRDRGYIHVELTDLQDLPDGYDCLGGAFPLPPWQSHTSRVMRLRANGRLIGTRHGSVASFAVPARAATYRLSYADATSRVIPVSTRTDTTWTFRSAAPAGLGLVRVPLLLVRYGLPVNLDNRPDGSTAILTVARIAGTPGARVTGLRLWTSTDNGRTWQHAPVRALGAGRFAATLPHAATGQAVSLRVHAADAGGSQVDQTIMTAYRG